MGKDSIFILNADVTIRDDDYVIYHRRNGTLVSLNSTGFIFVKLLNGKRTVYQIAEVVADALAEKVDAVAADALEFYRSLFEKRLIERRSK